MEENIIINKIESGQPHLSLEERSTMWRVIEASLPVTVQPVVSPYYSLFTLHYKTMTAFALMLLLIITGGGTAYASNAARPGDTLYTVDRALEDLQLSFALSTDSKNKLTEKLTQERLQELRDIIEEETVVSQTNITDEAFATFNASTTDTLEIEADVFIDTTVVKLELNDKKFYFETTANTKEGVIAAIQAKFEVLTTAQIEAVLDFEIEDRPSAAKDRGIATFKEGGQVRVNTAVDAILRFLNDTSNDDVRKQSVQSLIQNELINTMDVHRDANSTRIGNDNNRIKIRMDDDGDSRFEIREGDTRVRIEQKDGEVRVKTEDKFDDDSILENVPKIEVKNEILKINDDVLDDDSLFDRDDEDEDDDRDDDSSGRDERHGDDDDDDDDDDEDRGDDDRDEDDEDDN